MSNYLEERALMRSLQRQFGTSHTKKGPGRWNITKKKKRARR